MTIPQPPQYGAPQQYNPVQYQPPATPPQYGQPGYNGQAANGLPQQAAGTPAPIPSASLPGWGQAMGSGGGSLPNKDANGVLIRNVWQGGIVLEVLPQRQRTAPKDQGGAPQFFPDGQPKMDYPVKLLTAERDPANPNDKGVRVDHIQSTQIPAVRTVLQNYGAAQPEIGATLYRMRTKVGGPGGDPGQKSHEWVYSYTPPTAETMAVVAQYRAELTAAPPAQPQGVAAPAAPVVGQPVVPQAPVPAPPVAAAGLALPPEYAAAGWTAEQYNAQFGQPVAPQAPPPPVNVAVAAAPPPVTQVAAPVQPPAVGQTPSNGWNYGQPAAPQAPSSPPPGVPAPPAAVPPPPNFG